MITGRQYKDDELQKSLLPPSAAEIKYYFYFESNEDQMNHYYEYLREVQEILNSSSGSPMQVQIKGSELVPYLPSLITNCFRSDSPNMKWYSNTKGKKDSYLVKLKTPYQQKNPDELVELINSTDFLYEDDDVLIIKKK
jgi:hypothetical protein